jgi:hypothetical protein
MDGGASAPLLRDIRTLFDAGTAGALSDRQLLERYASGGSSCGLCPRSRQRAIVRISSKGRALSFWDSRLGYPIQAEGDPPPGSKSLVPGLIR